MVPRFRRGFLLDFGHIQVLIRNFAGTDQLNVALFQPCSQSVTYETRTVA
jgi:hypothetical protein